MEATTSTFINRKTSATCFHKHLLHVTTFCDSEETEQLFLFWTVQPVCGTATKISRLARHCACVAGRATHRFNMSSCPSCPFCDPLSKRLQAALSALFTSHAPKGGTRVPNLCAGTPSAPQPCRQDAQSAGGVRVEPHTCIKAILSCNSWQLRWIARTQTCVPPPRLAAAMEQSNLEINSVSPVEAGRQEGCTSSSSYKQQSLYLLYEPQVA